ncbi:hypothetical protein OIDMADRAFT_208106 [Oidiodendron maius Zn]|uniref:Uncharacterized protein n=1 Tax=Oidiodendron maius (strain Zn) TaxID=913774 RepID=A0A0C3GS78_OIDMZ|nr:hypothetical protein OIDMADRAFT_208106 [Oidiodendron maius Zn]
MKNPHLSWLDMFPSPRLRDNFIEYQEILDVWDLCYDLFGDLIGNYTHISPASVIRCCLIVWGEPWNEENWEITPGFLRKWAWLLKGCETLIESSNRWRAKRGEAPLQLKVDLGLGNTTRDESTFALEHKVVEDWQDSLLVIFSTSFAHVAPHSHKHNLQDITQHPQR